MEQACRENRTSASVLSSSRWARLIPEHRRVPKHENLKGSLMNTSPSKKTGLDAMLTPGNCALMLIDHQPFQAAAVKNIDVALMLNNAVALSKAAKAFGVPTLLTTVIKDRGGNIFKQIQDVFPEQVPIDRTFINTW